MKKGISKNPFGDLEGKQVLEYTLCNGKGMQVSVINYGATITQIITPDKTGAMGNVILGFDSLDGYLQHGHQYHGCVVGRYANRIAGSSFFLDGTQYHIASPYKNFSLHGGIKGFDKAWWQIDELEDEVGLKLTYESKDGEEGFPGNLQIQLLYKLTDDNVLILEYWAETDKATPVNLTNHCYFNLSAGNEPTILSHQLCILANQYTITDENLVPTGQLAFLKNTPMDFSQAKTVGKDILLAGGFDHNLILNNKDKAAELYEPISGRFMEMFTTEPALQFYSGNALHFDNETYKTKSAFKQYQGLCLEAQHYPNSPNEPAFPNTILRPGSTYRQITRYKFSIKSS